MYYVVNAILKVFPDDSELVDYYAKVAEDPKQESIKNPRNPRELLLENFFIPFLVTKIKELQCEYLQFLMMPQMDALVQGFKLPKNQALDGLDFTKMSD